MATRLLLVCFTFFIPSSVGSWASSGLVQPAGASFAYAKSHPTTPLPDAAIEALADEDDSAEAVDEPLAPAGMGAGTRRVFSRRELCSAAASVAQANDLPVPFFANLIWHESAFNTRAVSPIGAQGIAQFMPRTAAEYGLINPFEPIHALSVAGKFLRGLLNQFGNLGLAAAAYNAGPGRVSKWMAKRGGLPGETRDYVMKITGRAADQWAKSKANGANVRMPAKAPCIEVAAALQALARVEEPTETLVQSKVRSKVNVSKSGRKAVAKILERGKKISIQAAGKAAVKRRGQGAIKTAAKSVARASMRLAVATKRKIYATSSRERAIRRAKVVASR